MSQDLSIELADSLSLVFGKRVPLNEGVDFFD